MKSFCTIKLSDKLSVAYPTKFLKASLAVDDIFSLLPDILLNILHMHDDLTVYHILPASLVNALFDVC